MDGLYALAAALVITDLRTALQAMGGERRQVKRLFCPNAKLNVSSAYLRCQKFVAFTISSPPAAGFPGELGPAAVAPDFVHVVLSARWRFAVMPLAVRDCGTLRMLTRLQNTSNNAVGVPRATTKLVSCKERRPPTRYHETHASP